jgi:hypothetical protein
MEVKKLLSPNSIVSSVLTTPFIKPNGMLAVSKEKN